MAFPKVQSVSARENAVTIATHLFTRGYHSVPVLAEIHKGRIQEIVSEILEIDPTELSDTSLFKEDHGADSLRAIEILAGLERAFKVEIDQAELSRMVNLQGIYDAVAEAVARKG